MSTALWKAEEKTNFMGARDVGEWQKLSTDTGTWQQVFEQKHKQAIDWEEILATPISDKRIISQIYHEFL